MPVINAVPLSLTYLSSSDTSFVAIIFGVTFVAIFIYISLEFLVARTTFFFQHPVEYLEQVTYEIKKDRFLFLKRISANVCTFSHCG